MNEVKVWDVFVRFFHWSLVLSFFIAYLTEDDVMWLHEAAGYFILALVGARIIWGLIGTHYARFTNFVFAPKTVKQYFFDSLKFKAKRYTGHNPLGGSMVITLMLMLILTSWSGIEAHNDFWEEIHEFLAEATMLLVIIHIAGVLFSSVAHGENLIKAMWTGKKRKED